MKCDGRADKRTVIAFNGLGHGMAINTNLDISLQVQVNCNHSALVHSCVDVSKSRILSYFDEAHVRGLANITFAASVASPRLFYCND